jgi:hypothetical protein
MGNKQANAGGGHEGQLTKKGTFLNCACAKGKEETDGVATTRGKVTKLTEEEWAAVKAGRMYADHPKQPDLVSEELSSFKPESKKSAVQSEVKASNGHSHNGRAAEPVQPSNKGNNLGDESKESDTTVPFQNLRFKVGDRVRCVCTRYGNKHEAGSVIKIGFREKDWPRSKPSAPYQGARIPIFCFSHSLCYSIAACMPPVLTHFCTSSVKLDKGSLIYAPEDRDEYITHADEDWVKDLPAGSPWYLHPGALDRELAKMGVHR